MIRYQDLLGAKELLYLPERASMKEIRSNYRKLIMQWHPDKCNENIATCNEMTRKVTTAYKTVVQYCNQYKYSTAEEVRRYLSDEEWWFERSGNYLLWGNADK